MVCRMDLMDIKNALDGYQSKYGCYPTGNELEVVKILRGDNQQRYQFLNIKPNRLNPDKKYADPWGTPFAINFPSTNSVVLSSAGRDKTWGDKDDIIFNSISNGFVNP